MGPQPVIVLDTNVISELAKPAPNPRVLTWADAQPRDEVYATAISEAEMLFGVYLLPEGRRRAGLERAVRSLFDTLLAGRVLPFDRAAASSFASLASKRRSTGRPVGRADLQIAAIAQSRRARFIVTRDAEDFADSGTPLINPWSC